jgi:RNA methyltransferase, TrmH family
MIDNPRSPRVRAVARLARRAQRVEVGLFLVEGPQACVEALQMRPELVREIFVTPAAEERHAPLLDRARAEGIRIERASEQVLAVIADTVTPQGVIAVCALPEASLDTVLAGAPRLVAVLDEVRDPGNAGTIIRVADAAGADAVIITGDSVDPFNPKAVRASTGSIFHLPVVTGITAEAATTGLREAGLRILAADISGTDLLQVRAAGALAEPTAWLFGNEARGLSAERLALADRAVIVPIYGAAESLNLATAAAVCLYESAFAQRAVHAEAP